MREVNKATLRVSQRLLGYPMHRQSLARIFLAPSTKIIRYTISGLLPSKARQNIADYYITVFHKAYNRIDSLQCVFDADFALYCWQNAFETIILLFFVRCGYSIN